MSYTVRDAADRVPDLALRALATRYEAARDEALQANLAKTVFLSRMSHELRTPLHSVLGFAQALEMGALDDDQREEVWHIRAGGRQLLDLINEVLTKAQRDTLLSLGLVWGQGYLLGRPELPADEESHAASDEDTPLGSAWQAVTHPEDLLADADRNEDLQDSSQARKRHLRPDGVLTKPLDSRRVRALVDEPSRVRT